MRDMGQGIFGNNSASNELMNTDSTQETLKHIRRVQALLGKVCDNLISRAIAHDISKLEEPEKSGFDGVTESLRGLTYGSEEYKSILGEMKPFLDHHYAKNSHHPEHFPWFCAVCGRSFSASQAPIWEGVSGVDGETHRFCPICCPSSIIWEAELDYKPDRGITGMTLLDLVEMFCDWKAATERHADGSITKSIRINKDRFHITPQLTEILENTRKEMGWE